MTISVLKAPDSDIRNGATVAVAPRRRIWSALWRGFAERCPACGKGALYRWTIKVSEARPCCATALSVYRAGVLLTLGLGLALALLPRIKGAIIGPHHALGVSERIAFGDG